MVYGSLNRVSFAPVQLIGYLMNGSTALYVVKNARHKTEPAENGLRKDLTDPEEIF